MSKSPTSKASSKTVTKSVKSATKAKTVVKAKPVKKQAGGKKAAAKPVKAEPKEEEDGSKTRYFKVIVSGGDPHGRFSGTKPKQAATKALTSILRTRKTNKESTAGEIKFCIRECTRGSKQKTYNYIGERVKLENPMTVQIGGGDNQKTITYKFNNRVMKNKAPDQADEAVKADGTVKADGDVKAVKAVKAEKPKQKAGQKKLKAKDKAKPKSKAALSSA